MILKIRRGRAMQTEFVDEEGTVVFEASTAWKRTAIYHWTTTLTGIRSQLEVAFIEWHDSQPCIVGYRGMERNIEDYLFRQGGPGIRGFSSATGRPYVWSPTGKSWQLDLLGAGGPVARSHNRSFGIVGERSHSPYIEIDDAVAAADLEEIVLTFVYMKHRVQQVLEDCMSTLTPVEEKALDIRRKPTLRRRHLSVGNLSAHIRSTRLSE